MYPRIEDAGHYSPFHTIPFSVGGVAAPRHLGKVLHGFGHHLAQAVGHPSHRLVAVHRDGTHRTHLSSTIVGPVGEKCPPLAVRGVG